MSTATWACPSIPYLVRPFLPSRKVWGLCKPHFCQAWSGALGYPRACQFLQCLCLANWLKSCYRTDRDFREENLLHDVEKTQRSNIFFWKFFSSYVLWQNIIYCLSEKIEVGRPFQKVLWGGWNSIVGFTYRQYYMIRVK